MSETAVAGLTGLVLAGGESRRLGVPAKALADLGGRPLLGHVLDRLQPQVERVFLSVHHSSQELAAFGHELVVDVVESQRGPLTGLVSGLLRLECRGFGEWLLLCPCDAPFLPPDLARRLAHAVEGSNLPVAVARYEDVAQPVFSLWRLSVLPSIKGALLDQGRGGLMSVLDELPHATVDWPEAAPPPFFNVNTPKDLAVALAEVDSKPHAG